MSATSRRWSGSLVRRARAHWRPVVEAGQAWCWRCGLPILPGSRWHVGHIIDRALGGSDDISNTHPEHGRCSEQAGGRLAHQLRRAGVGKNGARSAAAVVAADLAARQAARPDWTRR